MEEKKSENRSVFIYGLCDPLSNELRYIGKTYDIKKRLYKHLKQAKNNTKNHKNAWLNGLLKQNLFPVVKILKIASEKNWQQIEKDLIKIYNKNSTLLNILPGGEGVPRGTIPWNKNTKGKIKPNKGSFKKGVRVSPKTEIKRGQRLSPKTEFKKGQVPPNCVQVYKYDLNNKFIAKYSSYKEAAKSINVTWAAIRNCVVRKTFKCKGFIWKINN